MKKCPNCQKLNYNNAKFCRFCGTKIANVTPLVPKANHSQSIRCPNCGNVNPPNSRFCNKCGTTLTQTYVKPQPVKRSIYESNTEAGYEARVDRNYHHAMSEASNLVASKAAVRASQRASEERKARKRASLSNSVVQSNLASTEAKKLSAKSKALSNYKHFQAEASRASSAVQRYSKEINASRSTNKGSKWLRCPACGMLNSSKARYCQRCGVRLQ